METTPSHAQAKTLLPRFKPTYKGWKLFNTLFPLPLPLRFKPTYKGWKQRLIVLRPHFYVGFKPTYKGWKQRGDHTTGKGESGF